MKDLISEFSFGCAVLREAEDLVSASFRASGAPVLPTLRDEKSKGYDAKLPFVGFALYFQFKRAEWVSQRHPGSPTWGHVGAPHYRWAIDTDGHQHQALLGLERDLQARLDLGDVLYAGPKFHLPAQLDDAYLRSEVLERSTLLAPSEFGDRCGIHRSVFAPTTGLERILSEPREPERLWTRADIATAAQRRALLGQRLRLDEFEDVLHSALTTKLQRDVGRDPQMPISQRIQRLCVGLGGEVVLALLEG